MRFQKLQKNYYLLFNIALIKILTRQPGLYNELHGTYVWLYKFHIIGLRQKILSNVLPLFISK